MNIEAYQVKYFRVYGFVNIKLDLAGNKMS